MFDFWIHILIIACIYGMLALSLNLQIGFGGLLNFGQIALFGCGMYGAALAFSLQWVPLAGLGIAVAVAGVLALFLARLGRNLGADYWAIATLSIAEIMRIIVTNEVQWTGGAQGVSGLSPLFGDLARPMGQYARLALMAGLVLAILAFCQILTKSRLGLALKVMREEPNLASSLGYDLNALRRTVMVTGGVIAAIAGFFYAHYFSFVGPDQLVSAETFFIWGMVIIGGLANNYGVIAGAFLLQIIMANVPFFKDAFDLPTDFVSAARPFLIGAGILVFLIWRPNGIFAERVGGKRV
ncbi:branched-chain amino acid ABC transporter permease [Pelagibacterium halotolerans]|uniref:High-affinity branched-chain amino acid transport system permease protein LivH / branched-chain amino acid transport system permease protein LivM n=1 Tax=Pelagibacterium halotolerans (strain DSM 22347 / JCM 15775 / CGMCC 1.7692 / B2) TaxID=1082931 RepID=G4R6G1_PELHB|nr:branched-chain amino acid ABC transporter permease [Pelagibacterium halotolerans]AEQ50166.1 high-affinity branched-chain amino acid transport system permease protein LivH / branched-chain amino acid transport system permease protein LivM [Pelagibacterium halotolerans B2]QJR19826.1 branched-chain amino acid ABC transporter permease [Pelagibacterium halotolerans]SEA49523.1 amino acid/amide ABC transporter membrane protein 2, HAAT family [Pelagibacterium halotolerans]